jgi:hypothetical protein
MFPGRYTSFSNMEKLIISENNPNHTAFLEGVHCTSTREGSENTACNTDLGKAQRGPKHLGGRPQLSTRKLQCCRSSGEKENVINYVIV